MNYECIVEIFEGINLRVIYILDDSNRINIKRTFVITNTEAFAEIKLNKTSHREITNLVRDEIDSIKYGDSTVKLSLEYPN